MLATSSPHQIFEMATIYDIATAAIATTMAGSEFAVAAFVHPQLRKLNDSYSRPDRANLGSALGKAMPLWYALALLLILGAAFEHRPIYKRSRSPHHNCSQSSGRQPSSSA